MTKQLSLCSSCDRHVRSAERSCPFCGAALPFVIERPRRAIAPSNSSRAATFAMHAAFLAGTTTSAACSSVSTIESYAVAESGGQGGGDLKPADASAAQLDAGTFVAPHDAATDASQKVDAAVVDASDEVDAGWVPIPLYGGSFPDPKARAKV